MHLPVQVAEDRLHLCLPVVAVRPEGGNLLLLLRQPVCQLTQLLRRNLLPASLQLNSQLVQTSLCIFGF